MTKPTSHEGFELRDHDRIMFEQKTGKSIMESIKAGDVVPESLMKEQEELLYSSMRDRGGKLKQDIKPKELKEESETFVKTKERYKPELDDGGYCIDYSKEERPVEDKTKVSCVEQSDKIDKVKTLND